MNGFWYRLLIRTASLFGAWFFAGFARFVATGYFLFSWRRVAESRRFYAALYPGCNRFYPLLCTYRQYQNFTTIHFDRFLQRQKDAVFTAEGLEVLDTVIGSRGGILLMSHLGNWEMAATMLKKKKADLRLLLYMGVKEKEGVERLQKEDLRRAGITIIGIDQHDNSPFSAVEGIRFLREGGLVSMTGDIVWRTDQRRVRVDFLGHHAYLPEAPFIFSLVSGAPLFVFFAFRTGSNAYHVTLSEPFPIPPHSRQERAAVIRQAAQWYADILEQALRRHPFAWYHFDRFLEPKGQ
jgi:predicted LPLAT superfamily acyltransferase